MTNQHLENCKDTFLQIATEGIQICRKYENDLPQIKEMTDRFENLLQDRLKDFNPRIMVYGVYNSGKSTIMNALMGQKKADMSDIPTTFSIDKYMWKEYTIYDTPGINAPKKDEEVSKEQLEKCDVILFVMDTEGQFALGKNYRELTDIIRSGKRLLIVLNNKSGFDPSDEKDVSEILKIERRIYQDFSESCKGATPEELAMKVKIILVNALDALNARTDPAYSEEERRILLDSSNISALEDAIITEYGKASSGFTVLHELEIQLNNGLDMLSSTLKEMAGDELTSKGKQALCDLQDLQDGLVAKVADYVHDIADDLDMSIYHILSNAKDEKTAQEEVQAATDDWTKRINDYMTGEIRTITSRIDNVVTDFSEEMRVKVGDIQIASVTDDLSDNTLSNLSVPTSGETDSNPVLSVAEGYMLQSGAKAILPVITKLPWIGPVVGKVLGPLVPVIGPIVTIASILIPFFGKSNSDDREIDIARRQAEAERRRQEEIARQKQEVKEESKRLSRRISFGIMDEVRKMISACFAPSLKMVQGSISKYREKSTDVMTDLQKINDLKQMLHEKVALYCNH